ncbi:hypothetical protein CCACVL1_24360 [Corchorus capsularis]|uniref:Uncharacterized protein n=1 Tax=Corchorus capsularis TaxID=210143 RepID=A0A1R3GQ10_COCAP|nr:hypothetical protein CCACVL1_24360 [Corchorus capsularis]
MESSKKLVLSSYGDDCQLTRVNNTTPPK